MTSIPIPASRMSLAELQEDADGQPRLYLTVTMGADEVALTRSQCAEILEQLQPYLSPEHSAAARSLASPETGEFGECLGFTDDGDLAEWIPDDAAPDGAWLLIQLRNRDAIGEVWSECRDKVWWNRHQNWLCALETGAEVLSEGQTEIYVTARTKAREIEEQYGEENLVMSDFDLGLLNGKYSALNWVTGMPWEASLDT